MDIDDQFRQIINNQEDDPMSTSTKNPMNFGLAIGALLIILAVVFAMIWGFGADRFGILAAGAGGTGIILVAVGAIINGNKSKS